MAETLNIELQNVLFYYDVDAKVSEVDVQEKHVVHSSGQPMLLTVSSASYGAFLQLWIPSIPEKLAKILDADEYVVGEVVLLPSNKPVNVLVYYKS